MSLLFDIFQLDQLSQIKELSLEGNSTLNDILDLQQSMYEDEQLQKSLKNLAYNYRKRFNSIKTSSRTFSDFYYLYKFIEELSDLDITSDDFNDIKDKEYFDELINDAKIYSSTFITDIGVERFEGYKQGIEAIKECLLLDKIIDNEDKYSAYKALEIEENKKLKEKNKPFLRSVLLSVLIGVVFFGIGLFFLIVLPKMTTVKYEEYLPYVSYAFWGIGFLIPVINFFMNAPESSREYCLQRDNLKKQIDVKLFEIEDEIYGDDLENSENPVIYLKERYKELHEIIENLDGNELYDLLLKKERKQEF